MLREKHLKLDHDDLKGQALIYIMSRQGPLDEKIKDWENMTPDSFFGPTKEEIAKQVECLTRKQELLKYMYTIIVNHDS
jgi:hypothetical protein